MARIITNTIILIILSNSFYCQNNEKTIHNPQSISNNDVSTVIQLKEKGETEKSLKKGLTILLSKEALTQTDSFYTYQTIAYNFQELKAFTPALEYAEKAKTIADRTKNLNNLQQGWIAEFYSDLGQHDSAIIFMLKEAEYATTINDTFNLLKNYNNIGWAYYNEGNFDQAKKYYSKIIDFENAKNFPIAYGSARGNLGLLLFQNKDYENALDHFIIDAEFNKDKLWIAYFGARHRIAQCHYFLKQYKKAEETILETIINPNISDEKILKEYLLLSDIYTQINDPSLSAKYLRKYIELQNLNEQNEPIIEPILKELSEAKINTIQSDLMMSKKEVDLLDEQLKSKTLNERFYTTIIITALILFAMYFLFYQNKQKKNKAILKLENDLLAADLKNKKTDLNSFGLNLKFKRKFIDDTQLKLRKIQKVPQEKITEEITLLIREFNNYKNIDKNIEVMQEDMDKVNASFFVNLKKQYPDLTKKEMEICGLLLLNLPTKDIAIIRNISPDSIKKTRQRIRKKLPIDKLDDLSEFLSSIQ